MTNLALSTIDPNEFEISSILGFGLNVALPIDDPTVSDCICPVIVTKALDCDDLHRCSCINKTVFLNVVAVCHRISESSGQEKLVLRLQNTYEIKNRTRLHFLSLRRCSGVITSFTQYIDSFELVKGKHYYLEIGYLHDKIYL